MSRRWGHRRLGRGVGGKLPEGQCLGRRANAFSGALLPAALKRTKIMQRTRLVITMVVSALAAALFRRPGRLR